MIVLASTSPFRARLLREAGIAFDTMASDVEESAIAGLTPPRLALEFARQKAAAVSRRQPHALVLGADQALEFEGRLLRKPATREAARRQLAALAGSTHALHSAIALMRQAPRLCRTAISTVRLEMRPLSELEIEAYLDTGEWQGCAGSYRIEARGIQLFSAIRGDYHAIVGLPMLKLLRLLRALGENPLLKTNTP